jgi:NMD protein affecting ribosome stability and mRNA decay
MNNIIICEHCLVEFADLVLAPDMFEYECPNCGKFIDISSSYNSIYDKSNNRKYLLKAKPVLEEIMGIIGKSDEEIKNVILYLLEHEILRNKGHRITINVGRNITDNIVFCSVCEAETTHEGYNVLLYDRWRGTNSSIYLCEEHKNGYWEGDIDLHKNYKNAPLGPV